MQFDDDVEPGVAATLASSSLVVNVVVVIVVVIIVVDMDVASFVDGKCAEH